MLSTKIRLLSVVTASFFLLALPASAQVSEESSGNAQPQREKITSFTSDIVVSPDGSVSVTEKIEYFFPEPKHGIFRDLPLKYELDTGETVIVPIEVVAVEGGPYDIEKTAAAIRIRIGDPNRTVSGTQVYVIKYVASGALRYFDDHDELYWNVTGFDWPVAIERVSATVYLPDGVQKDSVRTACYTGPFGSTESDCLYHRTASGASFAADKFLTVVVGWGPTGLVAKLLPQKSGFWTDYVRPYGSAFLLALLLPIGAFVFMYRRWQQHGRDPRGRGTLVVQYDPPKGMSPAEAGVLTDETVNIKDVCATIVNLAVRGYLKIRELPKKLLARQDFEFVRLKDYVDDATLRPYEKRVLKTIFGSADTMALSKLVSRHAFHSSLKGISDDLYDQLVKDGLFETNPESVRRKYQGAGVALAFVGFMFGAFSIQESGNAVFVYLAMLFFSAGSVGVILFVFGKAMPRKTEAGVAALEHARGFREYLATAEKYRLQWQEKENIFENFLPYAMVFGVAEKWTNAFRDITLQPQKWYEGEALVAGQFNTGKFLASMGVLESGLMRAVSAKPQKTSRGSGFGGGGFSGGGFGGGGGGSW